MFCTHCGAKLKEGAKFCASCGQPVVKDEEHGQPPQPLVKKKKMPFWLKLVAALAVLALIVVSVGILFTESIVEVIDEQLVALKANDVTKAYYAYTSKDFQKATSLDKFKQFVKAYPEFSKVQSTHFSERSIKDSISTIKGTLTSADNVRIPVEYQLIKENGKWKILNIQLVAIEADLTVEEKASSEAIITIVKGQLEALKSHDINKAYENFTSPEFKTGTDLKAFTEFVKRFPILSDYKNAEYTLEGINPEVAKLKASLHSDGSVTNIEYNFIKQDGNWKVWSLRVMEP